MNELSLRRRHSNPISLWEDFFDDFDKNFFSPFVGSASTSNFLKTDIEETDTSYIITMDIPGMDKDSINIDYENNYLIVSGERKSESGDKDDKGNYIRQERSYGSFRRSFYGETVKPEDIKANFKNGVLTITLSKNTPEEPKAHRIAIEG